jgi:hypothetical protein
MEELIRKWGEVSEGKRFGGCVKWKKLVRQKDRSSEIPATTIIGYSKVSNGPTTDFLYKTTIREHPADVLRVILRPVVLV